MCSKPLKVKEATYSHIICRLLVDDLLLLIDRTTILSPLSIQPVSFWSPLGCQVGRHWSPLVSSWYPLISSWYPVDIQLVSSWYPFSHHPVPVYRQIFKYLTLPVRIHTQSRILLEERCASRWFTATISVSWICPKSPKVCSVTMTNLLITCLYMCRPTIILQKRRKMTRRR